MNLNKTTQYAIRVLGLMALDEEGLYTASQLHTQLNIPQQYLRRMLTDLTKSGLIRSEKGRGGGVKLAKKIDSIFLYDILQAIEKKEVLNACIFGFESCQLKVKCNLHDSWSLAKLNILNILKTTSLASMNKKNTEIKIEGF